MSGLSVSVGSHTVCNEKFGKYISYKVLSESSRAGFRPGLTSVDRRYSDFAWLQTEFSYALPGTILPPLPDKNAMNRFTTEFIDGRRRSLERFLQRVASHPELSASPLLVVFLQADDAAFARAKEDSKSNRPKLTTAAVSWFEGTVNSIASGKVDIERSAADIKIDEMTQYIAKFEKQLASVVKHADAMTRRLKETSASMFEFGQSLNFLGQSEGDVIGGGLVQLGSTIETLSNCYNAQADAEISKFMEPVDDYARMMQSVKSAIQQRQDKRNVYMSALSDLESKSAAAKKLQGVAGKEAQLRQKEQGVAAAEETRDAAKADYECVTDRLMHEFELFSARKSIDLREIMHHFVDIQVEHNQRLESIWAEIVPKLQGIPVPTDLFTPSAGVDASVQDVHQLSAAAASGYSGATFPRESSRTSYSQSNFREEDDEDYSGDNKFWKFIVRMENRRIEVTLTRLERSLDEKLQQIEVLRSEIETKKANDLQVAASELALARSEHFSVMAELADVGQKTEILREQNCKLKLGVSSKLEVIEVNAGLLNALLEEASHTNMEMDAFVSNSEDFIDWLQEQCAGVTDITQIAPHDN